MITATESVSRLIRRLSRTVVGPEDLTKAVLSELGDSPEAMYSALEEILPSYCRRALGLQRRADIKIPPAEPSNEQEQLLPLPLPAASSPRAPISKKQERIRLWYALQLEEQFSVGGEYKMLGQCTATDLVTSAAERRQQAAGALSWANKLEALADALNRYQTETVAELPEVVFTDIWKPRS